MANQLLGSLHVGCPEKLPSRFGGGGYVADLRKKGESVEDVVVVITKYRPKSQSLSEEWAFELEGNDEHFINTTWMKKFIKEGRLSGASIYIDSLLCKFWASVCAQNVRVAGANEVVIEASKPAQEEAGAQEGVGESSPAPAVPVDDDEEAAGRGLRKRKASEYKDVDSVDDEDDADDDSDDDAPLIARKKVIAKEKVKAKPKKRKEQQEQKVEVAHEDAGGVVDLVDVVESDKEDDVDAWGSGASAVEEDAEEEEEEEEEDRDGELEEEEGDDNGTPFNFVQGVPAPLTQPRFKRPSTGVGTIRVAPGKQPTVEECFKKVWPVPLFKHILVETNRVGAEKAAAKENFFEPYTMNELRTFFGLLVAMTMTNFRNLDCYWRKGSVGAVMYPDYGRKMSKYVFA
jgi:hypothetical protein